MDENKDMTLPRQSGQREGGDRRKSYVTMDKNNERRSGCDRRQEWPIINEWSSPLKREGYSTTL
ncbi:MAG: hypothetical protein KKD44_08835 [Proteobacteria bacterium]|nr:hypothetical protein [Pseudomonadota bacterium]